MGYGLKSLTYLALMVATLGGNWTNATTPTSTEVAKLVAGDAANGYHYNTLFGYSVATDGDTAVIGAPDEGQLGAAYVFTRSGGVWSLQQKLTAAASEPYGNFGNAVAVDGNTVVIGARFYGEPNFGAAYVFTRSNGVWTRQQLLLANDGRQNYSFGSSVAVEGDTVLVGDPRHGMYDAFFGAVYVFTRSAGAWSQQQLLEAGDIQGRQAFGTSVALDADVAIIGAPGDGTNGAGAGAAYLFRAVGGVWAEQQKLLASDGGDSAGFGYSVAINSQSAVVGAYYGDSNGQGPGSAYVFAGSDGVWVQQQKLTPSDGNVADYFGISVAIEGNTAVIAAYANDENGVDSGSTYIFSRSGTAWAESIKLLASDGANYDHFGGGGAQRGVAISGVIVLVGAPRHDSIGSDDGAAYIYELVLDTTPPVIQPTVSGTLGNNGWYVSDVGISWVVTDPESAISTSTGCGPSAYNTDTAGYVFTCAATSAGGASSGFVVIKRDVTAPTITIVTPTNGAIYKRKQKVSASYQCADALSGILTCTGTVSNSQPINTSSKVKNARFTVTATDRAGNTATSTATYSVK